MKEKTTPPIVSIIGNSGSGKTTFIERLIPEIKRRGLKVGTIKHDVHGFEMDKPGKDTWRHKQAGASVTVISSPYQVGVVIDVDHDHRPEELLPFLTGMDLILTEGYKRGDKPKLEIFRSAISKEPLCKNDKNLLALVSDEDIDVGVPRFSSKEIDKVTDLLITYFNLAPTQKAK
ncbi:MAG: molybdopterin-guanine dinucleotide biosynthesis protein B [Desulfobacterales bacterium]|nr:MAG: molybdopterin-guanine dinucleotide biosynthesis protein B [Desulfobacterales bacterium]